MTAQGSWCCLSSYGTVTAVLHTRILGVQGPKLAQGPQVSLRVSANGYMSVSNSLQGDWSLEGIKEIQLLLRLVTAFLPWKFLERQQWHFTCSFGLLPLRAWYQPLPLYFIYLSCSLSIPHPLQNVVSVRGGFLSVLLTAVSLAPGTAPGTQQVLRQCLGMND